MPRDWIDEERDRRAGGVRRALTQDQHAEVNARYPGCTLEHCWQCDVPTGRAGKGDDSIYDDDGGGPYCFSCWRAYRAIDAARQITGRPQGQWEVVTEDDALAGGETLDFIDIEDPDAPVMGQCWPAKDGRGWGQAPFGDYVILAYRGDGAHGRRR